MARRIRWQIVIAVSSTLLILALLTTLALSNTTVARPLTGGSYHEVVVGKPQQLIPLINNPLADPVGRDIATLLFDGLTSIGSDGFPKEALAERWEIGEDGLVYTFHLRRNISWHDGTPFTANDVLFTLQAIQQSDFPGDPSLAVVWRNVFVERLDNYTIRCTLNAPYASFLSAARVAILPAHLLADTKSSAWAELPFAQKPIGTGPYKLTGLTADHVLLSANASYFAGAPFIEQIELQFIETRETAFALLLHEQVHAMGMMTTRETNQVTLPFPYRRLYIPMDEYTLLTFNMRESPLDDTDIRRALAHGLDKDALIQGALASTGSRLDTPILPGWWAYAPAASWYAPSKDLARQMLEDRGYTLAPNGDGVRVREGKPLAMTLITDSDPNRLLAAQEVARQWGEIGIRVEIEQVESPELRLRLRSHDFTLAIHGWTRLGPDPDVFELWHSSQATDGNNYAGLRDDTIDQALIQGRLQRDFVIRSKHYADFQQRWIERVPGITLYQPLYTFVVNEETGGMGFETSGTARSLLLIGREDRYRTIARWFVQSSREIRGTLR